MNTGAEAFVPANARELIEVSRLLRSEAASWREAGEAQLEVAFDRIARTVAAMVVELHGDD